MGKELTEETPLPLTSTAAKDGTASGATALEMEGARTSLFSVEITVKGTVIGRPEKREIRSQAGLNLARGGEGDTLERRRRRREDETGWKR